MDTAVVVTGTKQNNTSTFSLGYQGDQAPTGRNKIAPIPNSMEMG